MKKITIFLIIFLSLLVNNSVLANAPIWQSDQPVNDYSLVVSAYKLLNNIEPLDIIVPTVIEVPINLNSNQRKEVVVYDSVGKKFVFSYLKSNRIDDSVRYSVIAKGVVQTNLNDMDYSSCTDFDLSANSNINQSSLTLNYNKEIISDTLYLSLDNYVTLPVSLGIRAVVGGVEKVVLAPTKIYSQNVSFPKVSSNKWIVDVSYIQPLRICEASFRQGNLANNSSYSVRFLAEKDHTYQIYFDADRSVRVNYPEAPNLTNDFGVIKFSAVSDKINSLFKPSDIDNDGVSDINDNCVSVSNSDQMDIDKNGRGDVCDDFDKDGLINSKDNCVNTPNYNQFDTDADGVGDQCDTEEGRITEKYPWLPWAGMAGAAIVVIGLFVLTALSMRKKD